VHGRQEDFTDCGILAANTAAHDIFNDQIWTPETKPVERMKWFLALARIHMKDVRVFIVLT